MSRLFPHRPLQRRMSRRKRARRPFAMHQHVAKLGMPFLLHQVVADLVDQLEIATEHLLERGGNLLEDDQPV